MSNEEQLPVAVQNLRRLWFNKKANEKITQNDAAKALGWNQSLFSHYIANINKLSDATVWKLANFFEVSPYDIDPNYGEDYPDSIVLKTNNNTECVPVAPLYKAKPADLYRVTNDVINWKKTWNNVGETGTGRKLIDTVIWAVSKTSSMAKYHRRCIYLIRWKGEWKIQYIPKEMMPKATKASEISSIKPVIAIFM